MRGCCGDWCRCKPRRKPRCRRGPPGPAGPAGTSDEVFVNNTLFVDDQYGDDAKGQREVQTRPYKTLAGALAQASEGDTIHVRPGSYAESGLVLKNNVDFHFELGSEVLPGGGAHVFDDSAGKVDVVIGGQVVIHGRVLALANGSEVDVSALRLSMDSAGAIFDVGGLQPCTLRVQVNELSVIGAHAFWVSAAQQQCAIQARVLTASVRQGTLLRESAPASGSVVLETHELLTDSDSNPIVSFAGRSTLHVVIKGARLVSSGMAEYVFGVAHTNPDAAARPFRLDLDFTSVETRASGLVRFTATRGGNATLNVRVQDLRFDNVRTGLFLIRTECALAVTRLLFATTHASSALVQAFESQLDATLGCANGADPAGLCVLDSGAILNLDVGGALAWRGDVVRALAPDVKVCCRINKLESAVVERVPAFDLRGLDVALHINELVVTADPSSADPDLGGFFALKETGVVKVEVNKLSYDADSLPLWTQEEASPAATCVIGDLTSTATASLFVVEKAALDATVRTMRISGAQNHVWRSVDAHLTLDCNRIVFSSATSGLIAAEAGGVVRLRANDVDIGSGATLLDLESVRADVHINSLVTQQFDTAVVAARGTARLSFAANNLSLNCTTLLSQNCFVLSDSANCTLTAGRVESNCPCLIRQLGTSTLNASLEYAKTEADVLLDMRSDAECLFHAKYASANGNVVFVQPTTTDIATLHISGYLLSRNNHTVHVTVAPAYTMMFGTLIANEPSSCIRAESAMLVFSQRLLSNVSSSGSVGFMSNTFTVSSNLLPP